MAAQDMEFTDDLVINTAKGDFNIIESDQQHIDHIITASKGNFYEWPDLGVDSKKLINSSNTDARNKQVIKGELVKDDFTVKDILITKDDNETIIEVDATRRKQ